MSAAPGAPAPDSRPEGPLCRRCRHYHVTWDEAAPHGCRAMGFKSRELPIFAVRRATPGLDCQMFSPRPRRNP